MQSHYITHNNSTVHYRQFGFGPKLLFCFHGYGRESDTFLFLEKTLGSIFTMIAIDIPFHGLTDWKDELIFKPSYLTQFLLDIRKRVKKDHIKFSLLGFSIGGRIALYLTQLLPEKVDRVVLLAPDGLSFNFWRWFGTDTWVGAKLVDYTVHHPQWITWVLNRAEKWHLVHKSLADFVRYYIYDNEHRKKLYRRWISMRKFEPSIAALRPLITQNQIRVRMLFGAFDRLIPKEGGERFKQGMDDLVTVEVVEAGHNLLSEVNSRKIAQLIND